MATRLFVICMLATAFACKSKSTKNDDSRVSGGKTATSHAGRDAVENALLSLGIPGKVQRDDLNDAGKERAVIKQVHLMKDLLVLEGAREDSRKPILYAMDRRFMLLKWMSELNEPTMFPASENDDVILLVSLHYLHALQKESGRRALQFVGGALDGLERPHQRLHFRPTGSADAMHDTVYFPSLGSAVSNKNVESMSLVTGDAGWGYRTSSDIFNSVVVGGPSGDPKLYFMTRTGHLTCLDATNYGFNPPGPNWEALLDGKVKFDFFLTEDTKAGPGALYIADEDGTVYCLNRVTGKRLWTNDTQRRPTAGPKVFGDICVVKTEKGLLAFDADNVIYMLTAEDGDEKGSSTMVTARGTTSMAGVTFEIQNEVLQAGTPEGKTFELNGKSVNRAALRGGDMVRIGRTTYSVADRGTAPLWVDQDYDRVINRVGDKLVVARGKSLFVLNARTGERMGDGVDISGARFVPTNTFDQNIYAVGGDAVVYALFAR